MKSLNYVAFFVALVLASVICNAEDNVYIRSYMPEGPKLILSCMIGGNFELPPGHTQNFTIVEHVLDDCRAFYGPLRAMFIANAFPPTPYHHYYFWRIRPDGFFLSANNKLWVRIVTWLG
ncbi:hypothetical protein VNO77_05116 [Canavalia gladiata]|uniref:Uncharacterized protein n=1 Tax=Canavalia gladiata TaxID=3824 RepID=A0AAN9R8D2_CANGL